MVHQHNNEDHILLGQVVDREGDAWQELYVEHHNGDEKLNRRIMRGIELNTELKTLLKQHSRQTLSVDDEWKKGQEAIKELAKLKEDAKTLQVKAKEDRKKLIIQIVGWVVGIGGAIVGTLLATG